jgi:phosphatidylglycerophosphate synthase
MSTAGWPSRLLWERGAFKAANLVTLSRVVLIIPILWLLHNGRTTTALLVYAAAITTDVADGWLARLTGQASDLGAQLDATVDNVFSLAILAMLLTAFPSILHRSGASLLILFGSPLLYLCVSWLISRRLMMFHFRSAKVGGVLLSLLWPLIALSSWDGWIVVTAAIVGLSRLEQTIYLLRGGSDLNAPHGFGSLA